MVDRSRLQADLERGHVAGIVLSALEEAFDAEEMALTKRLVDEEDPDRRNDVWQELHGLKRVRGRFLSDVKAARVAQIEVERHG